ncbi:FAD-dependent oxidoreductase domain-containing protein 1 [Agrilus planipennis]|uniref:FAD-dependent oxidoreductase domain-containing protein 1 n=1 Tax=Agrilus planipennis TaxID=224129 RepID=A0A1W4WG11_AGRPL|nr:FAD-dependent oxidoreductase domain-containing protein 1 [Agrilus planipennis]XP_025832802.1 FAD-dependent oxidoreductase domain-containing protein 1 [Agrilus planipennis]XP_025832804.1 FAD-dependent oxidoreductase domain-containing protein 1 [Agrilus planipennis]
MFRRSTSEVIKLGCCNKLLHTSSTKCKNRREHPLLRTFKILRNDLQLNWRNKDEKKLLSPMNVIPQYTDIAIIGGGAVGSSIAYWLKEKTGRGLEVVVVEKDLTYRQNSTVLSVGGLRQQFSLPENIQMSLFGAEFLRTLKNRFGPDADVYFQPYGYLMLASEGNAQQLLDNSKMQKEFGAINVVLGKDALKERFPWLNVTDVEAGCLGLEKEGWFDPWSLLQLLRQGAANKGAYYVGGEVTEFSFTDQRDVLVDGVTQGTYQGIDELIFKLPSGEERSLKFAMCVLAAGAESGEVAKLCNIGTSRGILSIPLPVEKRKRYVYQYDCQVNPPILNTPMVIDYSGAYFRREGLGGRFIGGLSPLPEEEPNTNNLDVDYNFFDEKVWPLLANRVPAFNSIKVKSAWSGFYDYNTFDENGIIGPHPLFHNLFIATGFSGHGIQQAPAVGRAVAELILDGDFRTIDLTRLGFDRLIVDKPMYEVCII